MFKSALISFVLSGFVLSVAQAQHVQGELLIKMKGQPNAVKSQAFVGKASGKLQLKSTYGQLGLHHMQLKAGQDINQVLNELKNDPDVEYVEPNYLLKLIDGLPESNLLSLSEGESFIAQSWNGSFYSQSGNTQVQVTEAWNQLSQAGVQQKPIVAVIDSGLDYNHPVFTTKGAVWINSIEQNGLQYADDDSNGYADDVYGWNFAENNNNPMDSDAVDIRSHGTHVAGIVLGVTQPLSNTSPSNIKVMGLKFLGTGGTGSTSAAIQAIYYAVRNGAKVINMSWGGGSYSQALHDALAYAYNNGVVLVAAAGNSSQDNDSVQMFPANFPIPSQLTVGAVNDFDMLASFSNFGKSKVHITAPGVSVYSTAVNGYRILSGTSMAAPFVAGLAALVMTERPDLSGYQVRNILMNSSDSIGSLINKIQEGSRAQALSTLLNAQGNIGSQGFQPSYNPSSSVGQRAPASNIEPTNMGGCGMVSSSLMSQWMSGGPGGTGAAQPSFLWLIGLSLLPLIAWQGLRIRARIIDYTTRRRYERFSMNSEIKVKVGDRELVGQMSTISAGGLSFKADTLLEKGGVVTLQISSPDGSDQVEVQGRIVWSEENQAYGVQFNEEKSEIRTWSKQLPKAS